MNPDFELVEVTPDIAREWLGLNTHNRHLRERVINAYAADMAAGVWRQNGETIKFDENGVLVDGQHRLRAVVKSGCTVFMLVVRGLSEDVQETIDGGAKRTFSDALSLRGERRASGLGAIVRSVTLWESGVRRHGTANAIPTNNQLFDTLEKYPWLRDTTATAQRITRATGLPGSVAGLCVWLFSQLDPQTDSDYFFERLIDGQNLTKGNPIYELRRNLEDSARTVHGKRSTTYLTAITIKAWNAYRDGNEISFLRFATGGATPDKFPEPR